MGTKRSRVGALFIVGIFAAFALALGVDLGGLPEVTRFRDDAYYGFVWVRSLVEGLGPVISEGTPTSGVHPLWCLVLTVPALFLGSASIPAAAQVLGLVLHGATAALLAYGPGRGSLGGLLVGLVYLANPFLIAEAQNGQETALACFVLLVAWQVRRAFLPFFLASVLLVLTRSDLLAVVLGLSLSRHGFALRAAVAPIGALVALLTFNAWSGGAWLQDSTQPIPWLFKQNFLAGNPDLAAHLERWWWYLRPCLLGGPFTLVSPWWSGVYVFGVLRCFWARRLRLLPLVAVIVCWFLGAENVIVPLVACVLLAIAPAAGRRPLPWDLVALGLGLWVMVLAHEVWRHYPRTYYFAPLGIPGALALLPLARGRGHYWLVLVVMLQAQARYPVTEQRPWQEEMAMAGRLLDRVLGPEELIGCFNGGLVTWYRPDRVVNLDGSVNRAAFEALKQGQLSRYMEQRGLSYVLDSHVQFALRDPLVDQWPHVSGSYFGDGFDPARDLREVVRFDIPEVDAGVGGDSFRLYWRVGSGPPPSAPAGFADLGAAPGGGRYVRWSGPPGANLTMGPLDRPGQREAIARGEDGLVYVLRVKPSSSAPTGLFETGSVRPLLTLSPL